MTAAGATTTWTASRASSSTKPKQHQDQQALLWFCRSYKNRKMANNINCNINGNNCSRIYETLAMATTITDFVIVIITKEEWWPTMTAAATTTTTATIWTAARASSSTKHQQHQDRQPLLWFCRSYKNRRMINNINCNISGNNCSRIYETLATATTITYFVIVIITKEEWWPTMTAAATTTTTATTWTASRASSSAKP